MTSTDTHDETQDSGPSGYAAARLRLLTEEARSGPPRRATLARLTDDWLTGLYAAGAEQLRGASLIAVGGYGRGELSRAATSTCSCCTTAAIPRPSPPSPTGSGTPCGTSASPSTTPSAPSPRPAAPPARTSRSSWASWTPGTSPETSGSPPPCAPPSWPTGATRRRNTCPNSRSSAPNAPNGRASCSTFLEPDLKEARGGLRDATALRAVAASWLADAPREGLADARRRLLDVRDALHLTTGRATDRLALQEQDQVAAALGLLDADTLLRQVYEAARGIAYAGDVTWREVGRVLRSRAVRPRLRAMIGGGKQNAERSPLAEGVVEQDGEAVLARAARPERDPVLPLRAAAAAAQAGLPLSLHAVRRLAATVRPLPTPWPAEAREQLVTLLGAGRPTVDVWEALEAEGLITRLLPDWERVRCRPQRNAVHIWTVDRHLIETAVRASRPHPARAPPRPASGRRTAARHRQGLARRPLRGRRDHRPGHGRADRLRPRRRRQSSPPSYATTCCSSRRPPAATSTTRPRCARSPTPSGPRTPWNCCTP
ncbi:[protein-PII] uridylyltransferase [Streptomyces hirsutus]